MLTATLLALTAAVLHAGWNLAVKQSPHDRFIALWAQFLLGGVFAAIGMVISVAAGQPLPAKVWVWAGLSGAVHLPYLILLARAYSHGDFSQVYPIARGGGAFLAAIGGVVLLGDDLKAWGIIAILTIALGLVLLAGTWKGPAVAIAAGVAVTICAYTLLDSKGARSSTKLTYGLASAMMTTTSSTIYGVATGRTAQLRQVLRVDWRRFALAGFASLVTYTLVLVAVRYAPVGYVTGLRESSVVLAALIGWKMLGEGDARRRLIASAVVLVGLILLVTVGR
jgi:drug/metabolite transporter (DMT)-like permease